MTSRQVSTALAVANGVLFALTLCFTPLSTWCGVSWVGYDWDTWHAFVVPHLALSALLVAFYSCGVAGYATDRQLGTVAGWFQPLAAGTYLWAMTQWPGGDDGGGMSWLLIVGPPTGAALVVAAIGAAGPASAERGVAARARMIFAIAAAVGFGILAAIPWLDILIGPLVR